MFYIYRKLNKYTNNHDREVNERHLEVKKRCDTSFDVVVPCTGQVGSGYHRVHCLRCPDSSVFPQCPPTDASRVPACRRNLLVAGISRTSPSPQNSVSTRSKRKVVGYQCEPGAHWLHKSALAKKANRPHQHWRK